MNPAISIVSLMGREPLTEETIGNLNSRGGMHAYPFDLFYFGRENAVRIPDNCTLHWFFAEGVEVGIVGSARPSMMNDFYQILEWVPPNRDWIFFEDDIAPCLNAVRKIVEVEIPDDVGLVSFFDLRNEWIEPGLWRNRKFETNGKPRHLYGTQAVKIPARVVPLLQQFGRERRPFSNNWDLWMGLAIDEIGLDVAHYAPSLVQHVGAVSVAYPQTDHQRPLAHNFPGEDFDALGPCPNPIVTGAWKIPSSAIIPRPCPLHLGECHPNGFLCPQQI